MQGTSFCRASLSNFALMTILAAPLLHCGDDTGTGASTTGGGGSGGVEDGGGGGTAGSGGTGGTGGAGASGPINAPADEWTFIDFPEAVCMNGTPTGIAINPHASSEDVLLFLEGGNACFNLISCLSTANLDGYDAAKFASQGPGTLDGSPYLDRDNAANPLADFSYVYVPYCTGDVHAGDIADVMVAGEVRQFHGHKNMGLYLDRLVQTFPNAKRVVLSGASAGGFGAAFNYDLVAEAFGPSVKVTLIDDSGPPMGDQFIAECLQSHLKTTWGLSETLPADCVDCAADSWAEPFVNHILTKFPERSIGLISSEADATITTFWAFGEDNCAKLNSGLPIYPEGKYLLGLEDLRDRIGAGTNFGMFLVPGDEHVFMDNGLNAVSVDGVKLEDWIRDAIAEEPTWGSVSAP